MSLKKFSPTIRTEQDIEFKTNYKSTLDDIADKDGKIETKLNKESMIQAVSHKLYRNAESGFRELLNNEIRACQIARDKHNAKPYLKVSLNTLERKLIIQGFNSQGITEEVFGKILREIGTSTVESKKDGRIPFGMGFFGFLKLSDIAFVQTRCIENNDCYGFMAKGGLFFKKIQKPTYTETGTKMWLTLKPKTNYEKIIKTLIEASKVSGIKTYFELQAHKGKICGFGSGIHTLKSTSIKKIFDDTIKDNDYSYLTSTIDNENIEAHLSIGIDQDGELQNDRQKELFLVNSPIQAILDEDDSDDYDYENNTNRRLDEDDDDYDDEEEEDKKLDRIKASKIDEISFNSIVINMKKESEFPPHQDRERLTPNAEKKLRAIILELYNKAIGNIKPCNKFQDWFDNEHKYFISASKEDLKDVDKLLEKETKKINQFLNSDMWSAVGKPHMKKVKELIADYDTNKDYDNKTKLFYIERKDSRIKRILDDNVKNHFMFYLYEEDFITRLKRGDKKLPNYKIQNKIDDTRKAIEQNGFVEARKYIKDNKLKLKTEIRTTEKEELDTKFTWVKLHNSKFDHHSKTVTISSTEFQNRIPSMIKVKNYSQFSRVVNEYFTLYLVKDDPKIDLSKVKTPEQVYEEIQNNNYLTNYGILTPKQILKQFTKASDIEIDDQYIDNDLVSNDTTIEFVKNIVLRVPKKKGASKKLYIIGDEKIVIDHLKNGGCVDENLTALGKLLTVFCLNKFENVGVDSEELDDHYKESLTNLEKQVRKAWKNGKRGYGRIDDYDREDFDNTIDYEIYLIKLKEVSDIIKDKNLRTLFIEGLNDTEYFIQCERALEIYEKMKGSNFKMEKLKGMAKYR